MQPHSFGYWLKRRRKALDLTQAELADQVGCSAAAIRKIEAEERRPSAQIVKRLAEIFKIPSNEQTAFLHFARGDWKSTPTLQSGDAPWRVPIPVPQTNLPIPLTSFIGREKEVQEIIRLLNKHRLVTLTGPGGVGKTRLAIQSSSKLLSKFKGGVWWVELAPLTDEALVPQAIAKALGLREIPNQSLNETLSNFLRSKQLLLVLDNCEHLIAGCAQLADGLLSTCPNLKILTTSREALGLTSEEVWSVPILSLPNPQRMSLSDLLMQYEGIRLFVERASAAKSDFTLTERNTLSVAQVCQRLDGMPLAIELAAARVKMMAVSEIAKRLDDRFDLLTAGSRTALPRHQTLRAAIDWSYDLLSEPERIFLSRLSVFAGGFTLDAAEEVAAGGNVLKPQVTHLLGQLINKSLVTVAARLEDSESETRYGMLETIREYAREKLDESDETERLRQQHCDFFVGFAEQAEPKLKGADQFATLDRLEREHGNLRAAWDCAIKSDAELALRLASALLGFWLMRGNPSEGREWSAKLLERTKQWGQTARRAHTLSLAGRLAHFQADFASARMLLEQALSIARVSGDKKEIAFALLWLGRTASRQRDEQIAQSLIEEALTIYQELQDEWGIVMAFHRLAELAKTRGEHGKAQEEFFMKTLAKYRNLGDRFMAGEVLNALGEVARFEGDYERAGTFYEQALEILRELGSRFPPATPLVNLAWVSLHGGDYRKARALFEESLKLNREYGDTIGMVECLGGFAAILGMTGKPEQAARLFGAVESLPESSGMAGGLEPPDQKEFDHYVAVVHGQLDEAAFEKAWAEGRAMTMEQAIAYALENQDS
jgi:predicted ATPase/DNA-binding XRE family transcriptional regulator